MTNHTCGFVAVQSLRSVAAVRSDATIPRNVPGSSLVEAGLRDAAAGVESTAALLVAIGAPWCGNSVTRSQSPGQMQSIGFIPDWPTSRPRRRALSIQLADPPARQLRARRRVRRLATGERIRAFLDRLGQRATEPATVYLTGGATAVLMGWRDATIDIDLLDSFGER